MIPVGLFAIIRVISILNCRQGLGLNPNHHQRQLEEVELGLQDFSYTIRIIDYFVN